jgi:hypothetical protein
MSWPESDLCVQLPDMRAMKFESEIKDRERLTPGYWFVAPYGQIDPEHPTHRYEQYQIGPYIYDNDGVCFLPLCCYTGPTD